MGIMNSYTAVDVETTGLKPGRDKILEIAAVQVLDGKIQDCFTTLVNPGCPIGEEIVKLTGITDSMVKDAPEIGEVIGKLIHFLGPYPLLGHNVKFDYSFLKQAAVNEKLDFDCRIMDTLGLCRAFMPRESSKSLGSACSWYGISQKGAHRAQADAVSAHLLYQELLSRYGDEKPALFEAVPFSIRLKPQQPATKRQKDYLRDLAKYHRINVTVQIDGLSRSEASRLIDGIISQHGRMIKKVSAE